MKSAAPGPAVDVGLVGGLIAAGLAAAFCLLQADQLSSQPLLAACTFFLGFATAMLQPAVPADTSDVPAGKLAAQSPPHTPMNSATQLPTTAPAPAAPAAAAPAVAPRVSLLLTQLRQRLAPLQVGDDEGARFLAYKRGDVAKAAKLLAACAEWRRREGIDGILDEPPLMPAAREEALVANFNPVVLDGRDLKGRCARAAAPVTARATVHATPLDSSP